MAFTDDVKKYVDRGIAASKDAFAKAGGAVSRFGDQSVRRVEKLHLENKLKQQYAALGEKAYEALTEDEGNLDVEQVRQLLDSITAIKADIRAREQPPAPAPQQAEQGSV